MTLASVNPFFIVKDVQASIAWYRERLGFRLDFQGPDGDPYYARVSRDGIGIMLKAIASDVPPCPNRTRHAWARWDAFIYAGDPDALFDEVSRRGASFVTELSFIDERLWGFEVSDADGYVLAFAHVRGPAGPRTAPRLTAFAPQFLVDDLRRSMTWYEKLGFSFGAPWDGFYAIGRRQGLEVHLKEAPQNPAERHHRRTHHHLDAAAGVDGIEAFYAECVANGITIVRPLAATAWHTKDFYVEDPDGYVIAFGGRPSDTGAA